MTDSRPSDKDITLPGLAAQAFSDSEANLRSLLELSYNLSATLELGPQLDLILDQLKLVVDYHGASILKLEGELLTVVAYRGPIPSETALSIHFPLVQAGANREVIRRREPVIITDVLADTPLARAFRETAGDRLQTTFGYLRSWLGVPLIVRDQVIGMLSLDHPQPDYYLDTPHSRLALAFANQVAVAIENARLYAEARQRADEAQTLFAVQQAITSRLDPDAVLQMIANEARRLTNTRQGAVYLLDGEELRVSVISGEVQPDMLGYRLPLEGSVAGQALRIGQPILIPCAQTDERVYADIVRRVGAGSFLIVPLMSGAAPIGTITVANKKAGELGLEDERVLTMLASSAVIGLENARLYQEEQKRRRVAESLRDILAVLNSNRTLSEVLDYIVGQALQLLGACSTLIRRGDRQRGIVTTVASCNLPPEFDAIQATRFYNSVSDHQLMAHQPVVIPDLQATFGPLLETRGEVQDALDDTQRAGVAATLKYYHSYLAVPLFIRDEIYGSLSFYYIEPREFSEEDIRLAMTLGDQTGLAIENARLRLQAAESAIAKERSRLARDLHDAVTQTLFSASLIAEVLPILWERKPEEGRRRLEELRQLTRGALAEMRTLLLELRPSTLIEAEVAELFRHLADAFTGRSRVPVHLSVEGNFDLPPDVKVTLYRIAQESLNNIARHAGASQVFMDVRCFAGSTRQSHGTEASRVELVVRDDGCGFDPNQVSAEHLGLDIMRERAENIAAQFSLTSEMGTGTQVSVIWNAVKGDDRV